MHRTLFTRSLRRRLSAAVLTAALLAAGGVGAATPRAEERICFPEVAPVINDCITGRFAQFWRENGGLSAFGYPISDVYLEHNNDLGRELPTQWFERQRFELHADKPKPYDVQLGRLGAEYHALVSTLGFNDELGTDPQGPHHAPETGFNVGFVATPANPEGALYWDFYHNHGLELDGKPGTSEAESLAYMGHPITPVFASQRNDTSYQLYERALIRYQGAAYAREPEWRMVGDRLGVWFWKMMRMDPDDQLQYP